ncbi:hypothetical protein Alo02nite_87640 [Actinoplanes lobatus]|uniref:Uncharacterized protein n=1 Tax=Actinoplanes lobatus TaxID=113568 RepID=A0ABQ4AXW3_9ACTN|nr:hypothetical protein Alo02nite_87640 [Actinoplanes lobatus]
MQVHSGKAGIEFGGVERGGAEHFGGRLIFGKPRSECSADLDREFGIGEPFARRRLREVFVRWLRPI